MKLEYLAKTGKIGNVVTRNRLMMPAMCSYTAIKGAVTDATVNHYARRAEGGVGVIVTEMVNPSPGCQCFAGNLDISNDEFVPDVYKRQLSGCQAVKTVGFHWNNMQPAQDNL